MRGYTKQQQQAMHDAVIRAARRDGRKLGPNGAWKIVGKQSADRRAKPSPKR
jgi:hypothetical protein